LPYIFNFLDKVFMTKFITQEGFKKIQEELEQRKNEIRQRIAASIKEAKEQGDLSENAEYSEAKSQQSENEARIAELEYMLKESEVVSYNKSSETIQMGSKIKVKFNGNEIDFQIVGSNEASPSEGKISNESPMGKGFMGKKKGDEIEISVPSGKMKYKILEVN